MLIKHNGVETDRELLITEVTRLREQYEELIKQMEQTQTIIDKQQVMKSVTVNRKLLTICINNISLSARLPQSWHYNLENSSYNWY